MSKQRAWALGATAVLTLVSLGVHGSGCAAEQSATGSGGSGPVCEPTDEICDGRDNDCDGEVDEGCQCIPGAKQDCYSGGVGTKDMGPCVGGQQTCSDQGLWGPCDGEVVPTTEICDGIDNSCNGMIDEGCECSPPVPETKQPCYTGPKSTIDIGACHGGFQSCKADGTWSDTCIGEVKPEDESCDLKDNDCNGLDDDMGEATCGVGGCQVTVVQCTDGVFTPCVAGQPELEICDGIDNDCDQLTDENFPEKGKACQTGLAGVCSPGKYSCLAGKLTCVGDIMPSSEKCDGIDNDCDGVVDNNVPGTGGECTTGYPGVCAAGVIQCKDNSIDCFPKVDAQPEICDGVDNDCNGLIDDGNLGSGAACNTGQAGACSAGKMTCYNGTIQCFPNLGTTPETCDGMDNNCNGVADEGDPGGGVACTTGQPGICSVGTKHCLNGALVCQQNKQGVPEVCNGIDDDCNGIEDDGNPGGGADCNTGMMGVCGPGKITCVTGALLCIQNVPASLENCTNGLDDDCDGVGDPPSTVYFEESFASGNANGWTLGQWWQIGAATASTGHTTGNADPAKDRTLPGTDNMLAGVIIGGNAPKVAHAMSYLTSPVIDISGAAGSVYLEFWRWLNSGYAPYMVNSVDVYNGTGWVNLWTSGSFPGVSDSSWQRITYDVTMYKSAGFQVRFGFSIGQINGLDTVSSWNVDDVKLSNIACP